MEFKVIQKHSDKKNKDYLACYLIYNKKEYFVCFIEWLG